MASPPISRLSFRDGNGAPIVGPFEWQPAFIEIDAPVEGRRSVALSLQGAPVRIRLEDRFGGERLLADWPRSGTGNYQLQLRVGDDLEVRPVSIRPQKISEAAFEILIEDLQHRLPTSVAIGLQKAGGLTGLEIIPPEAGTLAQEVVRLQRAIEGIAESRPGLAAVLIQLARDHHSIFRAHEPWVDRRVVRRPSPTGLVRALTRGNNIDERGQLIQVVDQRTEHTVDVYENQLVKLFVRQVTDRLHAALSEAEKRLNKPLIDQLTALRDCLSRARRRAVFLEHVTLPVSLPRRISMVLMRRDPYPVALAGWLEFTRGLQVELDEAAIEAPLENLPFLYQTWGALTVLDTLARVAGRLGYVLVSERLCERRGGQLFVRLLPDGKPLARFVHHDNDTKVTFVSERSFGAGGTYRSISFPQRPDIVLEVEREGASHLIIFDPKYKLDSEDQEGGEITGRPKKIDIDKMHAYRDAIRDAAGRRVVFHASILYPGPTVAFGDRIAALRAVPGEAATTEVIDSMLSAALTEPV